jgi:hypothetical protein
MEKKRLSHPNVTHVSGLVIVCLGRLSDSTEYHALSRVQSENKNLNEVTVHDLCVDLELDSECCG